MVILKLKVEPAVFSRLFDELEERSNKFQISEVTFVGASSRLLRQEYVNFARILPGERKFDGKRIEVTLELIEEVSDADEQGVKPNQKVTREMVDALFDLLGIFPRETPSSSVG